MTITKEKIHVVTSVERRRRWAPEEKRAMVQEIYQPGLSVSIIARKYGIFPSQLFYWRRLMENGALKGIESREEVVPISELKAMEKRVRELGKR